VSEFIRPLSPASHEDDEPTPAAELSIVLELAPGATIGELMRSLATAILIAMSGGTSTERKDNRRKASQSRLRPPGS
jgi:hypothetical protein